MKDESNLLVQYNIIIDFNKERMHVIKGANIHNKNVNAHLEKRGLINS